MTIYFQYISALLFMNIVYSITKYASIKSILSVYQIIFVKTVCMAVFIAPFSIRQIILIKLKDLHIFLLMVIFSAIETYILHFAFVKLPIVNASLVNFIQPFIMLGFGALFFKEKIPIKRIVGMMISLATVTYIIKVKSINFNQLLWYGIAFGNMFFSSIAISLVKKLSKTYSVNLVVFIRVFGVAIIAIFLLDSLPSNFNSMQSPLLLLIVLVYIYERFIIAKTYATIDINKIQPMKFLNIVFSIFCSVLIVNEDFTIQQLTAVCIIFIAMYISYGNVEKLYIRN